MAGDNQDEDDLRTEELEALAAVYPELVINRSHAPGQHVKTAYVSLEVEPNGQLEIGIPNHASLSNGSAIAISGKRLEKVSFLPRLEIDIRLPPNYPALEPPQISLSTEHDWLPFHIIERLENEASSLWSQVGQDQILFTYIDTLQEHALRAFDVDKNLLVTPELQLALLDYDREAKKSRFDCETFDCGVCLEPKKGSDCHRLANCSHVFCVQCLQDFYTSCITEGDISNVKCMAPKCGQDVANPSQSLPTPPSSPVFTGNLDPNELMQISLPQDLVQRYVKLQHKKLLESDWNTIYCPRSWCQGPARTRLSTPFDANAFASSSGPQKIKPPPPAERLAICHDCAFAFCIICHASWHGEYATCFPRSQAELTAEEIATQQYMAIHTQACPTCSAPAQKTHGCNHMICYKCDSHFCYLCGSWLDKANPYQHFNDRKGTCHMRLWELEGGDDGEGGGHAFQGGGVHDGIVDEHPMDGILNIMAHVAGVGYDAQLDVMLQEARQRRAIAYNPPEGAGLGRFLNMVQADIEDQWESDEWSGDEIERWDE